MPTVCDSTCGDGIVAGAEVCDDANIADGDGCPAPSRTAGRAGDLSAPRVPDPRLEKGDPASEISRTCRCHLARLRVVGRRRVGHTFGTCAWGTSYWNCLKLLPRNGTPMQGRKGMCRPSPTCLQRGRRACRHIGHACNVVGELVGHVGHGCSGVGCGCRACPTWAQRGRPALSGCRTWPQRGDRRCRVDRAGSQRHPAFPRAIGSREIERAKGARIKAASARPFLPRHRRRSPSRSRPSRGRAARAPPGERALPPRRGR